MVIPSLGLIGTQFNFKCVGCIDFSIGNSVHTNFVSVITYYYDVKLKVQNLQHIVRSNKARGS